MSPYMIAGVVLAVVVIAVVTMMLLTRRLREKYAVLWLVLGVVLLILALVPGLLPGLTSALGVLVPANLFFAAAIATLLGIALHLSWELSESEEEGRRSAEQIAILGARVDALERRLTADDGSAAAPDEPAR
ncbi:DUF2304 family protein [Microbacterium gorillae]|uniref:DUF2304 family protein n=1 Tax=Microbacterium gorillae TaxID=1231063 RepID=UPI0005909215|nr:DUF2304 family protein [Microbacterium gorillae]